MKIYILSPNVPLNPHLFPTMVEYFVAAGHSFVGSISECDTVFFDLHTRIANYNEGDINWVVNNATQIITWDEWDRGGMSSDNWPLPLDSQQQRIMDYIWTKNPKSVHFCRLLNKNEKHPPNLYPFEKPIIYEQQMVSEENLFNRIYDVVWIANSAPQRERLASALRLVAGLKCNIMLGAKKMPHEDWLESHRRGKMFVAMSGGGYSCEKKQNLFSIAALIQEKTDQLLAHPFENNKNCVMISENPTRQELDYLRLVVGNKYELYKLYEGLNKHMNDHYTKEAWANYYIDILAKHGIQ